MIISLDRQTQLTALAWMLIGFIVYFSYGISHSKLAGPEVRPSVGASV